MGDQFVCKICLLNFDFDLKKPMILNNCGHSICQECTRSMTEQKCPFCRQYFDCTLKNYGLLEYLEMEKKCSGVNMIQKISIYGSFLHHSNISLSMQFAHMEILIDVVTDGIEKQVFSGTEHFFPFFFTILGLYRRSKHIFYIVDICEWKRVRSYFLMVKSLGFSRINDRDQFIEYYEKEFNKTRKMVMADYRSQILR